MSGPKISATEMKRLHLFEEDRRRLFQNLVRLRDVLKRRNRDLVNIQNMLLPFYDLKQVKETTGMLGSIQSNIANSLAMIDAALLDGTNIKMHEVLQNLSALHDKDEETILDAENLAIENREKWMEEKIAAFSASKKAEGQAGSAETSFDFSDIISKDTALEEARRIEILLTDLQERATPYPEYFLQANECISQLALIKEDHEADGYSLFLRLHELDVKKVRPLREKLEKQERKDDLLDEKLSAELAKYHMLCHAAGTEPKKFAFEEESVEKIRYECAALLQQKDEKQEIREIMRHVRESLEKTGYTYLGIKEEEMDFYREVYRVHDDVVLHVIYDSMGKVTMEVAIMDEKERPIQRRETEQIVKEQRKFCEDYEKIFHAINESGLAMRKEADFPCSPDFAQVIDTSEFKFEERQSDAHYDVYRSREIKYLTAQ